MSDMDWELLIRYLAGACTDAERAEVDVWLRAAPENRQVLEGIRVAVGQSRLTLTADEKSAMLASLWREIGGVRQAPVFEFPAPRRAWSARVGVLAAAAAVLLTVGVAAAWRLHRPAAATAVPAYSVISTTRGQRLSVRLADGTLVSLAPGTTLRTPSTYGVRDRAVQLEGEAAFTVVHDSTRPFVVRTKRAVTRDLGTRFALRAYGNESEEHVAVAEGRVAVGAGTVVGEMVLGRSDVVRVSGTGEVARVPDAALDSYFAWTEGRLVFRAATLGEAVEQLGRWYDVDVRLESRALGGLTFSAAFEAGEGPRQVVGVIGKALNLDLDVGRDGRTYTLRHK